jgi:hypothetical protein
MNAIILLIPLLLITPTIAYATNKSSSINIKRPGQVRLRKTAYQVNAEMFTFSCALNKRGTE